jgi:hypothetical protein
MAGFVPPSWVYHFDEEGMNFYVTFTHRAKRRGRWIHCVKESVSRRRSDQVRQPELRVHYHEVMKVEGPSTLVEVVRRRPPTLHRQRGASLQDSARGRSAGGPQGIRWG